uniref:Uncharacterized protein n=1 Tax=Siphoviridae sp. ctDmQ3 TaxID=2823570 RepID=A0A8S5L841_9CAUD|nr:MAG TPA: hypothetical protein [Siphoviridae sp. ctDmQ3]
MAMCFNRVYPCDLVGRICKSMSRGCDLYI